LVAVMAAAAIPAQPAEHAIASTSLLMVEDWPPGAVQAFT
jgi:hypothetical protein